MFVWTRSLSNASSRFRDIGPISLNIVGGGSLGTTFTFQGHVWRGVKIYADARTLMRKVVLPPDERK